MYRAYDRVKEGNPMNSTDTKCTRSTLVIGGSGIVGAAIVREMCSDGYVVTFTYASDEEGARKLASESGATAVQFRYPEDQFPVGEYEIVVCTAGVILDKMSGITADDNAVQQTFTTNAFLPIALAKEYAPTMVDRKWGRFVFVGSIYSFRVTTNNLAYNGSKHALSGIVRTLALENAPHGITFNEVCPCAIESKIMDGIAQQKYLETGVDPSDFLQMVAENNPTGRMARAKDVSSAVRFLASDEAEFINGVQLPVDGGQTLE